MALTEGPCSQAAAQAGAAAAVLAAGVPVCAKALGLRAHGLGTLVGFPVHSLQRNGGEPDRAARASMPRPRHLR